MSKNSLSQIRMRGFRKAEASLRLEGMDPSGKPRYESIKARIISGEITYEQGRAEIFEYHTNKVQQGNL
ncbi:antitoxin VbhA family protein [Rosenbergiella australiborealis]|uniref:Antitoxin VbhA family protein n=1 Tax=Rosenbergiella australiborealis TaxID=1544696 RepID=A0ABS5T7B7_9GAMM|nr:antitoxin VbhA family protein [Rosenbergiella australiborealis]MBT0727608.1 antitoxin VbhA family protein [Rosenbergiella australiborealis]